MNWFMKLKDFVTSDDIRKSLKHYTIERRKQKNKYKFFGKPISLD